MSISLFPGMMGSQFQLVLTPSGKPTSDHKGVSGLFFVVVVVVFDKAISKHKWILQLISDLRMDYVWQMVMSSPLLED